VDDGTLCFTRCFTPGTGISSLVERSPKETFAPALKPHPYLPGVFLLDVPGIRLDGPCHRSCCVPNATREWLRARTGDLPALATATIPGSEPTAVFGVPDAAAAPGFWRCSESQKMWVKLGGIKNNAVRAAFRTAGFRVSASLGVDTPRETDRGVAMKPKLEPKPSTRRADRRSGLGNCNAAWNVSLQKSDFERLNRYQRVNHFPGTWELGRKDKLCANVEKMRRRRPDAFHHILPRSFVLPRDAKEWRSERERHPNGVYILKPPASSRGRGIRVIRQPSDVTVSENKKTLVQRYIQDPHLLDGYKYDLRVYVAVTSIDPLRVFAYREGLVRLATEKYVDGGKDLSKRCMHLTNYSVNSKRSKFTMGEKAVGEDDIGFKRSLTSLKRRFENDGLDFDAVWRGIKDIVTKTLVCAEGAMNVQSNARISANAKHACYELFGFDIVLDSSLKPWLLEVNAGPSLSAPSNLDLHIKHKMAANLFNLVGITPYDRLKVKRGASARHAARLTGVPAPGIAGARRSVFASGARLTNAATTTRLFPKKRDARVLRELDFSAFSMEALPRVIRDAEGELSRAGEFERCFPTSDPDANARYLDLFETRRYDNALLCAWEGYKKTLRAKARSAAVGSSGASAPRSEKASRADSSRAGSAVGGTASRGNARTGAGGAGERRTIAHRALGSSPGSTSNYSPSLTCSSADVDALASSLARRLGVDGGRFESGRDSLSCRAAGYVSSAARNRARPK